MAATATATPKPVTKKTKAPKEKKASSAPKVAAHPPYFQMIKEAISALKEKGGSSPHAIAKYLEEKHKAVLPANFKKMLSLQLKNSASKGKLTKVKASYKLSDAIKKEKAPKAGAEKKAKVPKAVTEKKPKAPKATGEKKPKAATTTTAPKAKAVKADPAKKKTKAVKPVKKVSGKKATKVTPAKRKAPKSIKSPAAKKTKKA